MILGKIKWVLNGVGGKLKGGYVLNEKMAYGEVRGYVCGDCNTGMGKLKDDVSIFARAIVWIQSIGRGLKDFM